VEVQLKIEHGSKERNETCIRDIGASRNDFAIIRNLVERPQVSPEDKLNPANVIFALEM